MRRLAMVVLAACSGSSPDVPVPAKRHAPAVRPTVVRAGHAAAIEIVAVTDDGNAAVTQDAMGATRLWPTLDGTAEPVVVHATAARELALGRDDDGLVIADLDPAGTLELVRIGPNGAVRGRAQIPSETTVEQIAMTPAGVLALRADQTLGVIGADGRERARLVPPSGARIVSVIARDGHALALIADPAIHARAIELAPVRWGSEGGAIALPVVRPVLAPDGRHLAMHDRGAGVAIVDVESGKVVRSVCAPSQDKIDAELAHTLFRQAQLEAAAPVGFVDAKTIACLALGRLSWWGLDGKQRAGERALSAPETAAIANGLTVTADQESLALTTEATTQYLGYGISNASMVRTGPLGVTVGHGAQPLLLDRGLHARTRFDLPSDPRELDDVMPLDDHHALVSYSDTSTATILHHLVMVDTTTHKATPLPFATTAYELRYEPATHLLALAEKHGLSVVALDPITMTFGARVHLSSPAHEADSAEPAIYLADPALAGGRAVIVARKGGDGRVIVDEYEAESLRSSSFAEASHTYQVYGEVAAVDRAGRTYIGDGETVKIYTSGEFGNATRVGVLPNHVLVRPSPDATRLVTLGDNRMQMIDLAGHVQWMIAAPTAVDAGWIGDEPFARFAAGLAKLDPDTGALLDRVCGWRFGLSPAPFDPMGDSQSVCDED